MEKSIWYATEFFNRYKRSIKIKKAIFPGSFDPFTNGHKEIVVEALKIFDKVVVAVGKSLHKESLFSLEERIKLISSALEGENVEVKVFSGLVVNFAVSEGAMALVRGLRTEADFTYEMQMALANKALQSGVITVFLPASSKNHYVSSSLIKEIISLGGDVSDFVPRNIYEALQSIYQNTVT